MESLMVEKQSSELLSYLNALISACLLSGTVTHSERRGSWDRLIPVNNNHNKPKELETTCLCYSLR